MTQEVFESILERCNELGSAADKIFYRLLRDYPDLTDVYGQKLEKELDENILIRNFRRNAGRATGSVGTAVCSD